MKTLLKAVGLDVRHLRRYRTASRAASANIEASRALWRSGRILICDEPVSALDVSVQAQILNLSRTCSAGCESPYLFISHNLAVVKYVAAPHRRDVRRPRTVESWPRPSACSPHPTTPTPRPCWLPCPGDDRPLDFAALASGRMSSPPCGRHRSR
ncbi:MAG: hypothetical protein U1E17_06590 [Geminicoccaceae bacterium]